MFNIYFYKFINNKTLFSYIFPYNMVSNKYYIVIDTYIFYKRINIKLFLGTIIV